MDFRRLLVGVRHGGRLDSEVAFDELGYRHGVNLAPGNTKPGSTCVPLIEHCFAGAKYADEKYFRGDSAYCWENLIRTLVRLGVTYTIAAHDGTTSWRDHIGEITDWNLFHHSLQEVMTFYMKRGNAENFIREEKYGYDLKHFPCLQLQAKRKFGAVSFISPAK